MDHSTLPKMTRAHSSLCSLILLLRCASCGSLSNALPPEKWRQFLLRSSSLLVVVADERKRRSLQWTGDVWEACSSNITQGQQSIQQNSTNFTQAVYQHTQYDDGHEPVCTCFWNAQAQDYWMQCSVGDETCDEESGSCSATHEFFLFSDVSGDLKQKSSCTVCTDWTNCDGIEERCTLVMYEDAKPVRCVLRGFASGDGSQQQQCDDCSICQDESSGGTLRYGVSYDCFGKSTPDGTCDTSGTAHVHNFEPVVVDPHAAVPIGGTFGQLCRQDEEVGLYDDTSYDDPYQKVCDCKNPLQGEITCDLFKTTGTKDCFATQCSELSEIFYFSNEGDLSEKLTCDYTTSGSSDEELCSYTQFSSDGGPTSCSIFSPRKGEICKSCNICKEGATYGIQYECFGYSQSCLTNQGRAVHNIAPVGSEIHRQDRRPLFWIPLGMLAVGLGFGVFVRLLILKKRATASPKEENPGVIKGMAEHEVVDEDNTPLELT